MSRRIVWPGLFTLQSAALIEAFRRGVDLTFDAALNRKGSLGIPVALRWLTVVELGIPRQPFFVFRRLRQRLPTADIQTLVASAVGVSGVVDVPFLSVGGDPMYLVSVTVQLSVGQSLSVAAYDYRGQLITGVSQEATVSSAWIFACPGMAGLRLAGSGTLVAVQGISQDAYANLPGWQRIQVVGLPAKPGELGAFYDSTMPQGFDFAPTTGLAAAQQRLEIAHLCRGLPSPTGMSGFPLPSWPPSSAAGYLARLREASQLYPMIERCLEHSVDADPVRMQSVYQEMVNIEGITQANLPVGSPPQTPTNPGAATIPVVGLTILGAGTDSDAATALGYGTIDLPGIHPSADVPPLAGSDTSDHFSVDFAVAPSEGPAFDYMVTAPYVVPGGLRLQLAALSRPAAPVQIPLGFAAEKLTTHAVLQRDATAEVPVALTWQPQLTPHAVALLVSRKAGQAEVLNTTRRPPVGGYDPYLGLVPSNPPPGTPPTDLRPNFKDAAGVLPTAGVTTTRYLVAGIDVFGQWSPWTPAAVTLSAAPVTQPGLRNVTFTIPSGTVLPTTGKAVPSFSLTIELAWDWTDRSPGQIRITGQFVPAKTGLGPPFPAGLEVGNNGVIGPPLVLGWNYTGVDPATVVPDAVLPSIVSGQPGSVALLTDTTGLAGNQVMKYAVTLTDLSLDFSSGDELYLALYATATERIRPGVWSDPVDNDPPTPVYIGRIVTVQNPLPPVLNFSPPAINWTALPDAYQKARGVLSWPFDPSVSGGYMVWEATESALLQAYAPAPAQPDPAATLVARGQTLKDIVAAKYPAVLSLFSRLNTDPIPAATASYEVEVPGNASVLYAYMVSAVSSQGIETPRQPLIAVFGVPRRLVPGQPRLRLRQPPAGSDGTAASPDGIEVICLEVESGVTPDSYRIYRVRSAALATDAGLMGPPKLTKADAGWQPFAEAPLHGGTTATGQSIVDVAATPSWYPYYYRVDAVGPEDLTNGIYAGQSLPSQVQSAYYPPVQAPLLSPPAVTTGDGATLVVLTTDLPIPPSPLGPSLVEVLLAKPDASHPGRTILTTVLQAAPEAISLATLTLPRPSWSLPLPHPGPHFPLPPPVDRGPALARTAPDAASQWQLTLLVPSNAGPAGSYTLRLTDPLDRQSSTTF